MTTPHELYSSAIQFENRHPDILAVPYLEPGMNDNEIYTPTGRAMSGLGFEPDMDSLRDYGERGGVKLNFIRASV